MSTHQMSESPIESEIKEMVFGDVVTVKPIPTRGVSQIVIEIPAEFHIQATQLLFGKNAFVFAGSADTALPFGLCQLGPNGVGAGTPTQQPVTKSNELNIVKWLGYHCKNVEFQRFMQCESEIQTIDRVRDICKVESRADIAKSSEAVRLFTTLIYNPWKRGQENPTTGIVRKGPWKPGNLK